MVYRRRTHNPSGAKRARRGGLQTGHLGIAVHALKQALPDKKKAVLSSTPINVQAATADLVATESVALIFTPQSVDLADLMDMRVWEATSDLDLWLAKPETCGVSRFSHDVPTTLTSGLVGSTCQGHVLELFPSDQQAIAREIIEAWEFGGLLSGEGDDRWSVTEVGKTALQAGLTISSPKLLFKPRY